MKWSLCQVFQSLERKKAGYLFRDVSPVFTRAFGLAAVAVWALEEWGTWRGMCYTPGLLPSTNLLVSLHLLTASPLSWALGTLTVRHLAGMEDLDRRGWDSGLPGFIRLTVGEGFGEAVYSVRGTSEVRNFSFHLIRSVWERSSWIQNFAHSQTGISYSGIWKTPAYPSLCLGQISSPPHPSWHPLDKVHAKGFCVPENRTTTECISPEQALTRDGKDLKSHWTPTSPQSFFDKGSVAGNEPMLAGSCWRIME